MSLKKLASLSFALALVYSISLPARAELIKNFKADGSIEIKSFGIDNENDGDGTVDDYRSETRTRVLLGGNFDLLDDVHSRILLRKNNRVHGGSSGGSQSESLNTVESNVFVDNAYVKIDKIFGHADLTVGRQFYGSSEDLLIYYGLQPDDLLSVTALDTFRADGDVRDWAKVTAMYGKIADNGATSNTLAAPNAANANSDTTLWGFEATNDKLLPKGAFTVGFYQQQVKRQNTTTGFDNNTLGNIDLKVAGDAIMGLGYYGQFVQNTGENKGSNTPAAPENENNGTAWILGVKANRDIGKYPLRARAEYGRGTDTFQSIAAGKRFGIIWGEHTGNANSPSNANGVSGAGLSNLKVLDFGLGTTCPVTKIGIDVNWYKFDYAREITGGNTNTNGNTDAGSEWDVILSHKHSENVSFDVSWARYFAGDANRNAPGTGTSPTDRLGANVKLKF